MSSGHGFNAVEQDCGCVLFPSGTMKQPCAAHEAAYRYREERDAAEDEIPQSELWERVDKAENRLIAAIRLHQPGLYRRDECSTCHVAWPCDTARLLSGVAHDGQPRAGERCGHGPTWHDGFVMNCEETDAERWRLRAEVERLHAALVAADAKVLRSADDAAEIIRAALSLPTS